MIKKVLKSNKAIYGFLCKSYAGFRAWKHYMQSSRKKLRSLKNIHAGQRCFIICNGPSLKCEDLDRISGEVTFGLNSIFKIYEKTCWRPTYYLSSDSDLVEKMYEERITEETSKLRFFPSNFKYLYHRESPNSILYNLVDCNPGGSPPPRFSPDASRFITEGYTVTYAAIQLACYMGFREIYITGLDFSNAIYKDCKGNIYRDDQVINHFYNDTPGVKDSATIPNMEICRLAYKEARKYADAHNIKIYNVSRSTRLDVFEKKDFDSINL